LARTGARFDKPNIVLDRVRWKDEQSFRILSYYFSVRWNIAAVGERIRYVFGDFAIPQDIDEYPEIWAPGLPPQYSIVERRHGGNKYHLLYGEGVMLSTKSLDGLIGHMTWHINHQSLRITGDFFLIHAGAVQTTAGDGILLPAQSGGGKTTLVAALLRHGGFRYLSDEAGAIDPVSRMLYPYPRALTVKSGHATSFPELYGNENGGKWVEGVKWIHPSDIRPGCMGSPCSIRLIVAPQYVANAPTEVTPLTPAQTAVELLTKGINLVRYRARAMPLVADIARQVPGYRLVSGNLDEAVATVVQLASNPERIPATSA
jgi:hypothetical protein